MAEPLRVLLMVRQLNLGGCERDLARIATALTNESEGSHFQPLVASFYTGGARYEELTSAGIPIISFPVRSLIGPSGWSGALALRQYIRQHEIGLIHTLDAPTALLAAPVARCMGVPIIASNLWVRRTIQKRLRYALRFVDRIADAIMVNSDAVRQDLIEHENTPPRKIHLCYNGVDTSVFRPAISDRPKQDGAPLIIGSVCVLRPEKRLDRLLEAFAEVHSAWAATRLLIVGNGPMLPRLEEISRQLGIAGACTFEPAKKDVAEWMRRMDIFTFNPKQKVFRTPCWRPWLAVAPCWDRASAEFRN